jgi:hypothetical protein
MPIGVGSKVTVSFNEDNTVEFRNLTVEDLAFIVLGLGALVEYESVSATAAITALDLREALAASLDMVLELPPRLTH